MQRLPGGGFGVFVSGLERVGAKNENHISNYRMSVMREWAYTDSYRMSVMRE